MFSFYSFITRNFFIFANLFSKKIQKELKKNV